MHSIKTKKLILICLSCLAYLHSSFSVAIPVGVCTEKDDITRTSIYLVDNGYHSLAQARATTNVLQKTYMNDLQTKFPNEEISFNLAYSFNATNVKKILSSIQTATSNNNNQADAFHSFNLYMNGTNFGFLSESSQQTVSTIILNNFAFGALSVVNNSNLKQKFEIDLLAGYKVILLGNSNGVTPAKEAFESLQAMHSDNIALIAIAPSVDMSKAIGVNVKYWTSKDDLVVNAQRYSQQSINISPWNVSNTLSDESGIDYSNHQLIASYVATDLESRNSIYRSIAGYISSLTKPDSTIGQGELVITLSWGSQPDVDLHITEPNGSHVYFSNPQGVSGHLDLDDTDGFGPEHYFVGCNKLEVGNYDVGVKYYTGSSAETAIVQITTADGNTRSFTKELSSSDAGGQVFHIATLEVSKDGNNKMHYTVQ